METHKSIGLGKNLSETQTLTFGDINDLENWKRIRTFLAPALSQNSMQIVVSRTNNAAGQYCSKKQIYAEIHDTFLNEYNV